MHKVTLLTHPKTPLNLILVKLIVCLSKSLVIAEGIQPNHKLMFLGYDATNTQGIQATFCISLYAARGSGHSESAQTS